MSKQVLPQPSSQGFIPAYSKAFRSVEISSLVAFTTLYFFSLRALSGGLSQHPLLAVAGFMAGWIGADFTSGLVHWFADSWGTSNWFLVGPTLIRSFREHHVDQAAICHHDFIETNGATALVALPLLLVCLFLIPSAPSGLAVFGFIFTLSLCFWSLMTNQIHKWAHSIRVPWYVTLAQRLHLILSKEDHRIHHIKPHDADYCITTGWMNPTLGHTQFFRRAESVITALTGMLPREDDLRLVNEVEATVPSIQKAKSKKAILEEALAQSSENLSLNKNKFL